MPRTKVKLAFITDHTARKASLRKRKLGLQKKLDELCTLCSVDACAIMYNPNESEPEVWPSNNGVNHVLERYSQTPEMEQSKKTHNQDTYINERINKTKDQLNKQIEENWEKKTSNKMSECFSGDRSVCNLSMDDLTDFVKFADLRVKDIDGMLNLLKEGAPAAAALPQSPPPRPQPLVCDTNTDNHMVAGGVAADSYVALVDYRGTLDGIPNPEFVFPDWMDDESSFIEIPSPLWPGSSSSNATYDVSFF